MANPNSRYLFYDFENVESIDLTYLDTSHVTNMDSMFGLGHGTLRQDSQLTTIIFGDYWDTSQVTDISFMFTGCSSFSSLNLSSFDMSQVTDMNFMFGSCYSLTSLDMRNATFNATSYSYMFSGITSGINIIVKDATAKTWIETRLSDVSRTGTVTIASA